MFFSLSLVTFFRATNSDQIRSQDGPKIRLFNRFSVINYDRAENIVSLVHICPFLSSFLCLSVKKGEKREIGRLAIKNFLRNGWNWEINRLIRGRQKASRNPFLSNSDGTSVRIAISSRLGMSDDTIEKCNRFLAGCTRSLASATPINFSSSDLAAHETISTLKSSWNMSSLKCLRFPRRERGKRRPIDLEANDFM